MSVKNKAYDTIKASLFGDIYELPRVSFLLFLPRAV